MYSDLKMAATVVYNYCVYCTELHAYIILYYMIKDV